MTHLPSNGRDEHGGREGRTRAETLRDSDPDPETVVIESDERARVQRAVREAMMQLSEKQQRMVEWTLQGLKPGRIARLLNMSSVSVRVELFRARKRLKKILEKTLKGQADDPRSAPIKMEV